MEDDSGALATCVICGDRSTGKHYGALSCDGCKGFFRRSVRKRHNYICRFGGGCLVDKDHRNTCRRCRFEACLSHGMRPEAVQSERDRIGPPSILPGGSSSSSSSMLTGSPPSSAAEMSSAFSSADTTRTSSPSRDATPTGIIEQKPIMITPAAPVTASLLLPGTRTTISPSQASRKPPLAASSTRKRRGSECCLLQRLVDAEAELKAIRHTVITKNSDARKEATTLDVTDSMHQQLVLLVEWAKRVKIFVSLDIGVQLALLRHFAAQHLVLCAAYRSTHLSADALWLTNDTCLPKISAIPDITGVAARILDTLTKAMRRLSLSHVEYVALKGIAFFDPLVRGVEDHTDSVQRLRDQLLDSLELHLRRQEHRRASSLHPHPPGHRRATRGSVSSSGEESCLAEDGASQDGEDINTEEANAAARRRLSQLLLLLPTLVSVSRDLIEDVQLARVFQLANVDYLMTDLLIPYRISHDNTALKQLQE